MINHIARMMYGEDYTATKKKMMPIMLIILLMFIIMMMFLRMIFYHFDVYEDDFDYDGYHDDDHYFHEDDDLNKAENHCIDAVLLHWASASVFQTCKPYLAIPAKTYDDDDDDDPCKNLRWWWWRWSLQKVWTMMVDTHTDDDACKKYLTAMYSKAVAMQ